MNKDEYMDTGNWMDEGAEWQRYYLKLAMFLFLTMDYLFFKSPFTFDKNTKIKTLS